MSLARTINPDLQKERNQCTFNVTELTHLIDGGAQNTEERKKREEMVLKEGIHIEEVPAEYLSHKEKYESAVKKACLLFKMIRRLQEEENTGMENYRAVLGGMLGSAILQDGSPLTLHYVMFIPTLMGQATVEQQAYWIGRAFNLDIIGTYAQTELGHGTFIRGLETTATYDTATKEFVLHSPTLTSYKWWPGGLAHTANYCIVMAQLYTKGQCHGIHPFIVQLRDEETHMPLPGIKVGEIGAKLGMNGTNNGFLGFECVRIPRDHMLMKNSKVLEDGTYVNSPSSKLTYGTMMFVRVVIVQDMCNYMAKAVTIATRYSAVRHQSQLKPEYLVKAWQQARSGGELPPTVSYLSRSTTRRHPPWDSSLEGIIDAFHMVAAGKINLCVANIEKRQNLGMAYEDAWNMTSVQLTAASEAHCRAILVSSYYEETKQLVRDATPPLRVVLLRLVDLYAVYWALQCVGDLLRFTSISERDIEHLQGWYESLLATLRPDAVGLVDAFDISDEILHSALGSYDGRVYERLMEEAMKSPLNKEPVNNSFHKYLKPFMQGKL
ncbi:hypothetical protein ACJJTC_015592 [Scirpophaga incertulas]